MPLNGPAASANSAMDGLGQGDMGTRIAVAAAQRSGMMSGGQMH
jgi:hypothetical protein